MNTKRRKKLINIICILLILSTAVGLVLYALKQNINLFYTPTQLLNATIHEEQIIRIGGYVEKNSVHYAANGQNVQFKITDNVHDITIDYHGVLPNLFREGQGVVVTGKLNSDHNNLLADQVLAKHDEKYMPWPLAKALQRKTS